MTKASGPAALTFRPAFGVTIVAALMVLVLLALGIWQVKRHFWKSGLIAEIDAVSAAVPAEWDFASPAGRALIEAPFDRQAKPFGEKIALTCFRTGASGHTLRKGEPAEMVALPFVLELARDAEGAVASRWQVVYALMPPTAFAALTASPPLAGDCWRATGVLRVYDPPNRFTPANDPTSGTWFWPDIAAMAMQDVPAFAGEAPGYPMTGARLESQRLLALTTLERVTMTSTFDASGHVQWVRAAPPLVFDNPHAKPTLTNNHAGYAATWFTLAIALGVIYFQWHARVGRLVIRL